MDEHREQGVVKRPEKGPQLNSTREDKKMTGIIPSSSSNSIPNSSLVPGSILFPFFGDPMIDVHLSQMQGVVGLVPQSATADGGGNGGGNNDNTPPLGYNGFSLGGKQLGPNHRHLSLMGGGGGGGPPDAPPDDEDEDDDDDEDDTDEDEEDDNRPRRGRRRFRDDREIKNERPRISRKEAERVSIPPWPKIHQLDNWKMQLLMNVLSACADPDTETWAKWLDQALGIHPDLNLLSDSGGDRFATIDIKMAMGMQNMLRQELVALVMQSFRTSHRTDLDSIEHLFNLDFPGDKNLVVFRNKWYDLQLKMRNEDRPRPLALRDTLFRKIKGSKKMEFGLNAYHRLPDKHPQKFYAFLLALIDHQIKSDREDLMLDMKEKSVKTMMKSGGKDAAPAAGKQGGQSEKGQKNKSKGPDAPVLPKAKARVMQARTASLRDRGKSRVVARSYHAGITSKQKRDASRGTNARFLTAQRQNTSWRTCPKESPNPDRPHQRRRMGYATRSKKKCENGSSCKYKHGLIKKNWAPANSGQTATQTQVCPQGCSASNCKKGHRYACDSLEAIGPRGKGQFQERR